jgi:phosphoribosylpyrophosphate synthetase
MIFLRFFYFIFYGEVGRDVSVQVIVTNTIPTHPDRLFPELTVLSVANLLGETIWRVYNSSSVQSLL